MAVALGVTVTDGPGSGGATSLVARRDAAVLAGVVSATARRSRRSTAIVPGVTETGGHGVAAVRQWRRGGVAAMVALAAAVSLAAFKNIFFFESSLLSTVISVEIALAYIPLVITYPSIYYDHSIFRGAQFSFVGLLR